MIVSNLWNTPAQVCECYFILEPDIPKDSSTEVTCILRAIDHAAGILRRKGIRMPEHLVLEVGMMLAKEQMN